jgi:hypothetical protein
MCMSANQPVDATSTDAIDSLQLMWSRWNHIQSSLFPFMREEIEPLSEALGRLITILDVIGLEAFVPEPPRGPGRPLEDRRALARAFVAKVLLGVPTTSGLIERLEHDKSLRRILGWERRAQVPSEATFSRAFAEFANSDLPGRMHAALVGRVFQGRIVGVIARDATQIDAREKPANKEPKDSPPPPSKAAGPALSLADPTLPLADPTLPLADPTLPLADPALPLADPALSLASPTLPVASEAPPAVVAPPRKRGRPRKGEEAANDPPKPEPTRIERQTKQTLGQMLADLPSECDVGTKKNAKGYKTSWTGYKLHIDVASGQIPVSCVLTSASVHDSQVAIPLMTMTSARIIYLYEVMDAAYDANAIADQSKALGHVPITDRNFRAQHEAKAEWAREVERMKFIHMPDFDDVLYDFRTMVERVNGRLKDEFGAAFVRVRGAVKVKCHLMFGVLVLAVDQIFRLTPPKTSPA